MKKVDFYGKMTNKDRIRIRVAIRERLIFFGCRVHSSKLPIVRGRPFYAQHRHAGSARHRLGHREQMRAKPGGSKGRLRRGLRSGSHGVAMGPTMGAAEHPVTTAALRAGRRHQVLVQGRAHFLITIRTHFWHRCGPTFGQSADPLACALRLHLSLHALRDLPLIVDW